MSSFSDNLGHNIQYFREMRHLTQRELAEAADISSQYLSNLENGKAVPSADIAMRIATSLKVTCDSLLSGNANTVNKQLLELISLANDCSPQELEMILDVSKAIKANYPSPRD